MDKIYNKDELLKFLKPKIQEILNKNNIIFKSNFTKEQLANAYIEEMKIRQKPKSPPKPKLPPMLVTDEQKYKAKDLIKLKIPELKKIIQDLNIDATNLRLKKQYVNAIIDFQQIKQAEREKYSEEDLIKLKIPQLKKIIEDLNIDTTNLKFKNQYINAIMDFQNLKSKQSETPKQAGLVREAPPPKQIPCSNETDLLFEYENTSEIPKNKLISIKDGKQNWCFDVDQLYDYLLVGQNKNPYTNSLLFKNNIQLNKIFSKVNISQDKIRNLIKRYFPKQALTPDETDVIKRNYNLFNDIGYVGNILLSDYNENFTPSTEALAYLSNEIQKLSQKDQEIIYNIKIYPQQSTLRDILNNPSGSCIHGYGKDLIKLYLSRWISLPSGVKKDVIPVFSELKKNVFISFNQLPKNEYGDYNEIFGLFIIQNNGLNPIFDYIYKYNPEKNHLKLYEQITFSELSPIVIELKNYLRNNMYIRDIILLENLEYMKRHNIETKLI
jgi:hypothetical protein